ncbi:MAG: hypothetical protein ABSA42_03365 [Terracidiphilus sp.]|jgi:hypothetical protein
MRKVGLLAAVICAVCLTIPLMGSISLGMAQPGPRLTAEQAIAAARRNAKPGSSFTVLREIVANADTRRIGDQALEQAQAHKIELYENGILVNILRSGGYLLAETNPRTNNMVATHLVLMEAGGAVKDVQTECHGVVKLADAGELVKDTAELVKQMYSTPSTEVLSLASRFYGGNFPEEDQFPDSSFAIPNFLRRPGANPSEVREAAALFWGYALWAPRYALSMPAFAASPAAAENAAEKKRDTLKAEFLQSNNMDPKINLVDFDNIQNERQIQERIELLTRLDRFLEDSLRKEADPAVVRPNLSILTMPLRVDVDLNQEGQYVSTSPPKLLFLWHRLETGGFAVKEITWGW